MRAVVQRVSRASVTTTAGPAGAIGRGYLVLLGITHGDTSAQAELLARKVVALRVFEDAAGKMNRSLKDAEGAVLCVSQFTLYGDIRQGNRPSFIAAAPPDEANQLYDAFCDAIAGFGVQCERGVFGAHMTVDLVNDGPVTLILDTDQLRAARRA
jgi:D-tyrosyl-tRNA(Tyr) deacylase